MRIAIIGAGGTGGYFGGLLARAGEEVTFLARGRQLEGLRTHGLTVKSMACLCRSISPCTQHSSPMRMERAGEDD